LIVIERGVQVHRASFAARAIAARASFVSRLPRARRARVDDGRASPTRGVEWRQIVVDRSARRDDKTRRASRRVADRARRDDPRAGRRLGVSGWPPRACARFRSRCRATRA
jgi:hypothetical protein